MRLYDVSMPAEFGLSGIKIGAASSRGMVEKRVRKKEWTRKSELMKEGVRRMYFQPESGLTMCYKV